MARFKDQVASWIARAVAAPEQPSRRVEATVALKNTSANPLSRWNTDTPDKRSGNADDASHRIIDGFATVHGAYQGRKFVRRDPVFTIGSCFARELESHLKSFGGAVLSMDKDLLNQPAFLDAGGRLRSSYFHRYTPQSISQQFASVFDELEGWDEASSLIFPSSSKHHDFNYGWTGECDMGLEAVLTRRRVARELVRRVSDARLVVITLGFVEAWRHKPSDLFCNKIHPSTVRRQADDFELVITPYDAVLDHLERAFATIARHHRDGDFELVVTVSPVPLQATFTDKDVIIANMESKATLRAAAGEFVRRRTNTHYFPSYEIAMHSQPDLAWGPDRAHVRPELVRSILRQFADLYYQPGELAPVDERRDAAVAARAARRR